MLSTVISCRTGVGRYGEVGRVVIRTDERVSRSELWGRGRGLIESTVVEG